MSKDEKIKEIQELQHKLYDEDNELFERIMKLEDIINSSNRYKNISQSQFNLLDVQFQAMRTYHQVLRARINDFQREIYNLEQS